MIAAFSITPIGAGASVSTSVAEAVDIVRHSGLPNETNSMFTNIEGDWDEVMGVIGACVEHLARSAPRLSLVVKADIRPGAEPGAMLRKVATLEARLRD